MSEFSELLSRYIHSKNVKVYSLSQYCGLDRSNLYKVINGKRNAPSLELVEKMCVFMKLSPAESSELLEAYHISVIGYENYYRRGAIRNLLSNCTSFNSFFSASEFHMSSSEILSDALILNNTTEINSVLFNIITREEKKEKGHIKMIVQPDFDFLMDFLTCSMSRDMNLKIEHIVCMNNSLNTTRSSICYNIDCINAILKLYNNLSKYQCFFYYDNVDSKRAGVTVFPYMVLTSDHAVLISSDLEKGYATSNPDTLEVLSEIFSQNMEKVFPMFRCIHDPNSLPNLISEITASSESNYWLQRAPFLAPFLSVNMLRKYTAPEFQKELAINNLTCFFSLSGVKHFLKTGHLLESPSSYPPLEIMDRVILIQKLIEACKKANYQMLKSEFGDIENDLLLMVNQQSGCLMFQSRFENRSAFLMIEEPGLLSAFLDFCESIDDSMLYTTKETTELLQKAIDEFKQAISS